MNEKIALRNELWRAINNNNNTIILKMIQNETKWNETGQWLL